ncbi:hypothetical protein ACFL27_19715 [candidate division CSSED10-310 bacterium]|uniref:Uncharacterized protein n=1 Tax=candidate division CSSED10-310 bacterium TaxID=2855610 RepID=A0ABV6Z1V2_UNCC1
MNKSIYLLKSKILVYSVFIFMMILISTTAVAADDWHVFYAGNVAHASEVNDNFDYLKDRSWSLGSSNHYYLPSGFKVGIGSSNTPNATFHLCGDFRISPVNTDYTAIRMYENDGYGIIRTYTAGAKENLALSRNSSLPDSGFFAVNHEGDERIALYVYSQDHGSRIRMKDSSGDTTIFLDGEDGSINGNTKNFVMDHPRIPELNIVYASIEGPEAAAYVRGSGTLINGEAIIELPEHFSLVVNDFGLTVHVTPLSATSEGLAVVEKSSRQIVVVELRNGKGNYDFDYIVKGVRRGYENYQVIRQKSGALLEHE